MRARRKANKGKKKMSRKEIERLRAADNAKWKRDSSCGPFGCKPKIEIPNWGKLQGKKKKKVKKVKGKCKEGKKGDKCRMWKKRGCKMGKVNKPCRDKWYKANPAPPPKPLARPWQVAETVKGKAKKDFDEYVTGHSGFSIPMQGMWFFRGKMFSCGGSEKGRVKDHCKKIKQTINRWISRQESFYKSGMPAFAASALMKGGQDTATQSKPKKAKKAKKKEEWKPDWARPGYKRPKKKTGGRFNKSKKYRRRR